MGILNYSQCQGIRKIFVLWNEELVFKKKEEEEKIVLNCTKKETSPLLSRNVYLLAQLGIILNFQHLVPLILRNYMNYKHKDI